MAAAEALRRQQAEAFVSHCRTMDIRRLNTLLAQGVRVDEPLIPVPADGHEAATPLPRAILGGPGRTSGGGGGGGGGGGADDAGGAHTHMHTPLSWAAATGNARLVQALVGNEKHRVAPDAVDSCGRPPLVWAAINDQRAVAEGLIAAGCAVDFADADGWTALHWAAWVGREHIASILLKRGGADHRVRDKSGAIPLHLAARCGHRGVYRELLAVGGPRAENAKDSRGWTPLHWATYSSRADRPNGWTRRRIHEQY